MRIRIKEDWLLILVFIIGASFFLLIGYQKMGAWIFSAIWLLTCVYLYVKAARARWCKSCSTDCNLINTTKDGFRTYQCPQCRKETHVYPFGQGDAGGA